MSSKKQDEYTAAIREADAARKQISPLGNTDPRADGSARNSGGFAHRTRRRDCFSQLRSRSKTCRPLTRRLASRPRSWRRIARNASDWLRLCRKRWARNTSASVARIRDGVAVAEARNGACMACFMALRPQAMAQVRRGEEIVTCDNCNRILYFVPSDASPAKANSVQPKVAHT